MKGTHESLRLTDENDALSRVADDPGVQHMQNQRAYIWLFVTLTVAVIATLVGVALISGGWLP